MSVVLERCWQQDNLRFSVWHAFEKHHAWLQLAKDWENLKSNRNALFPKGYINSNFSSQL